MKSFVVVPSAAAMTQSSHQIVTIGTAAYADIPPELRSHRQWVCWRFERRDGRVAKVLLSSRTGARAKSNDQATWTSFETAQEASSKYQPPVCEGIGFVFSDADEFVGIDLDNS